MLLSSRCALTLQKVILAGRENKLLQKLCVWSGWVAYIFPDVCQTTVRSKKKKKTGQEVQHFSHFLHPHFLLPPKTEVKLDKVKINMHLSGPSSLMTFICFSCEKTKCFRCLSYRHNKWLQILMGFMYDGVDPVLVQNIIIINILQ